MAENTESSVTTLDDAPATPSAKGKTTKAPTAASAAVVASQAAAEDGKAGLSGEMVTLTIHRSHEDGGNDAVFISHGGFARQVPRDTPVVVPREVAQVIADAKETSYYHDEKGKIQERVTQRFAHSITPA